MDGAVAERLGQCLVHEAMLVEEREPVEARAHDRYLKVVAAAGAVLDVQLARVGERMLQECVDTRASACQISDGFSVWASKRQQRE